MGTELLVKAEVASLVEKVDVGGVEQADPQHRLGSARQALDRAGRDPPAVLLERRQRVVHSRVVDDLFQGGVGEALPIRSFGARPRQVHRFGLPDQVVELSEHESCVAASQLGVDAGEH